MWRCAIVLLAGCSVVHVSGPRSPREPAGCTEGYAAPILDVAIVTALASFAVWDRVRERPENDYVPASATAPILIAPALLFALSSAVGFSGVRECRRAREHVIVGHRDER